ncbi:NAD-dependent epimerase/dehydratase family protein [Myroides odoratimimus]|uniref:NAD-dependent epimerase/dehydratase family protein n=1 Tax=Myroides odoratimimus TaxID=76832 RepID=UPI0010395AE6|nr:NAD-dependent epimerase/dehydratase family protein [Myroides odoratimimus]QBK77613.1 NAD-dependent epimerase/dehydratase family protein [Myroides odoratimimus]WHT73060.1 NAD-dependent epimerase/dehydratase family protein [Myroides odoratimimus]WHU37643.1 NAD-dependent epimerase/dehydratase family protein [Myroides odoratimimus]
MIVVFGASGFIGMNMLSTLGKEFDIDSSSLRDLANVEKIYQNDIIINLVGKAHDHKGEATEQDFYYANYELVKELYTTFIKSDAKLFIHVSSIAALEENGRASILTEDMDCNPISWYGQSKRKAEEYLLSQDIPNGKKVIILRPTMVHGPGDKGNLTLLYKIISKGFPYPLAKFDNQRSFLSIGNFSFIISEIIKKSDIIDSGVYHICDDKAISTSTIISLIGEITGKKVSKLFIPKNIVKCIAKIGDFLPIPLNTNRLVKMTSNLVVSNNKIKSVLRINRLPIKAEDGMRETLISFNNK